MRTTFTLAAMLAISCFCNDNVYAQANTSLSNLANPTAINRDLIPASTNTLSLGTVTRSWKYVFGGTSYYLTNLRIIHSPGATNFFAGPVAGNAATTGTEDIGFGHNALGVTTSGSFNTALGYKTMQATTVGNNNTAVGNRALYSNTNGSYNTAAGTRAMYLNTTGWYNTGLGYQALYSNSSGSYNAASGYYALRSNTTGSYNTASGSYALYGNTTARYNTALGYEALRNTNTGEKNTASGYNALRSNTTGNANTATGNQVLLANTTGGGNTAAGSGALVTNTEGIENTATGLSSMYANTTGWFNSAYGSGSLLGNTTGSYNVAIGHQSLINNTTAYNNTAVGGYALSFNTTGQENTAIGSDAGPNVATLSNTTAVGYNATPTASNQVMLGNSSVTSVRAASSFVIYSDGRFKKDLNQNVPGLEFIKLLRPVTYHYDVVALEQKINGSNVKQQMRSKSGNAPGGTANQVADAARTAKEKKVYTGFVAQEVEDAAKKLKYEFSGVYAPQNENDVYGLSYSDFVVPLVKGMQELTGQNDSLKQEVTSLQQENLQLQTRLAKIESLLKITPSTTWSLSNASIAQNSPNPFRGNTVISYTLPQDKLNTAQIVIYDVAGKKLKQFNVAGQGNGSVNIDANTLAAGTYQYSLFVNGKVVDTKKMVLIK